MGPRSPPGGPGARFQLARVAGLLWTAPRSCSSHGAETTLHPRNFYEWFLGRPGIVDFGGRGGPPDTVCRGRRDPQHRRFLAGPKTMHIMLRNNYRFRAGNRVSGRILIGEILKIAPPAGRWPAGGPILFDVLPTRIRPKSGPETRCPTRKHYCATSGVENPGV